MIVRAGLVPARPVGNSNLAGGVEHRNSEFVEKKIFF